MTPPSTRQLWIISRVIGLLVFVLLTCTVPARICGRDAARWLRDDTTLQDSLASGVERWIEGSDLSRDRFSTGSGRFSGEWLLGTYQMAAIGFAQIALARPEERPRSSARIERCIDRMLSAHARSFDREAWGEDALDRLADGRGHAGYLGYTNLALSLHRLVDPRSKFVALNDRLTAALMQRVATSSTLLVETYPGEVYPVDNTPLIASIALHARATGRSHEPLLRRWVDRLRRDYVDHRTGLLFQAVDHTGRPRDRARGSGTVLASYFLSFLDPTLSRELYGAVRRELASTFLGFGLVREYPRHDAGRGDIDSGPVVLGFGVSATGFSLGAARVHGDGEHFARAYATAHLVGAPRASGRRRGFVVGGPLGDAIMLAMLTARSSAGGTR